MNVVFSFIPIIILIIIVGMIVFITKLLTSKKTAFLSGGKIRIITVVYVLVLLVAMGLNFSIPYDKGSATEQDVEKYRYYYLNDTLSSGNKEDIEKDFIRREWEFPFEGDSLTIVADENDINGVSIIVARRADAEKKIHATFYQTPASVEGIEITDQIMPPELEVGSNKLTIRKPFQKELNYTSFKQPLPVQQFTEEKGIGIMDDSFNRGSRAIYISVPKDLPVTQVGFLNIEYLSE